jgi:sporulation protein YlmC with PRC-barrel domain
MMSKLAIAAALSAVLTAAYAQTPAPQTPAPEAQVPQSQAPQTQAPRTTTGVATPAQAQVLSAIPNTTTTITSYYKKNVYDRADAKIGEITDVLVDRDGKIDGFMMAVGGFLGIGEKNVAVPFDAVKVSEKSGGWWLTMDSTKDQLEKAPGFKYDSNKVTWVPAP